MNNYEKVKLYAFISTLLLKQGSVVVYRDKDLSEFLKEKEFEYRQIIPDPEYMAYSPDPSNNYIYLITGYKN